MFIQFSHAKAQRREEIWVLKSQFLFAPLRLCVIFSLCSFFITTAHSQTNTLSDAEIQGRAWAQKIFEVQPTENYTNTGVLKVKDSKGRKSEARIEMQVKVELTNWYGIFISFSTNGSENESLTVAHPNNNRISYGYGGNRSSNLESFANSDFAAQDFGLAFLYWPEQKFVKKDIHRSCGCIVLESTNPDPGANGYSHVMSWIDTDSLGIVEAYAYDRNGKLLKDFEPEDVTKVNGQWQVQTLLMENVQTGSKSRIEFDLKK